MRNPVMKLCGDSDLVIEFGDEISEEVNKQIIDFMQILKEQRISGVTDLIPTFRSLMVHYNPELVQYKELKEQLQRLFTLKRTSEKKEKQIVEIPVCYGDEFGPDLSFVAEHAGITEQEVIDIHSGRDYLIYMLGFLPGFPYLGGMDQRIFTPRLETPRIRISAGSVGIGGEQTGLYPIDSPGGWRIIGRTPIHPYCPDNNPPIIYEAGQYIRFIPITKEQFFEIQKKEETNNNIEKSSIMGGE